MTHSPRKIVLRGGCAMMLGALFFVGDVRASAAGKTYYVSATGNNANAGTLALPFRNIQYAANLVAPGDTVYVRGGTYKEQVKIRRSGSAAGGYVSFRGYSGEVPAISGAGLSPNGQSGLVDIANQSYVVVQGFDIGGFTTASSSNVPVGVFISGAGSNIQILNNHVHNISTTVTTASGNALGVAVYGSSGTASINNLVISGNEVDHLTTGQSESVTVNGNVQNFQVTNNKVHDNNNIGIDVIGFEGTSPVAGVDQARDGVISGNLVYNITSAKNPAYGGSLGADGIYVDGGTRIVVERNTVHHADIGIELACEHKSKVTSYVTARSNVVYASYMVGVTIGGYAANVGGTDHCTIVNNTLYQNDTNSTGSGEFQIQYHATNNIFDNNIVSATAQGLFVNSFTVNSVAPSTLNNNLYFSSVGAANGTWLWNNVERDGFTTFQSVTKNDLASKFANPQFVNAAAFNFRVAAASPAVGAGVNLGTSVVGILDNGGASRVIGTKIDIGAYEQ
ncbi:MAG: right-handed parallel beta-helix repeat-containing protein [Capsulimonas sp.]|uniref:right-handed parallel beta-helix repeat-containing protein n=1 Tax=Capsulimonas sp. TaxID=2494211 RepID=UPI003263418E